MELQRHIADRDCPLSGPNLLFFEIEAPSLSISHSCKTPQHIIFLVVWFSQRVIMFNISYTSYNKFDSLIILSNHESYNVQNINIWERCKYCLSIICFIYVLWIITSFIFFLLRLLLFCLSYIRYINNSKHSDAPEEIYKSGSFKWSKFESCLLYWTSDSVRHRSQNSCLLISQIVLKNFIKKKIIKECPEEILIKLAIVLKISKFSWNPVEPAYIVL